ncbi:MAG: DUF2809 domain-containing protein [Parvularculaceae bacterium]|nr:DUF2809 domain-containing protein [Parvularculaceae bacterium]
MTGGKAKSPRRRPDDRLPRPAWLAAAAVFLLVEIAIAIFATGFLRHTVGDVLVVVLLYALARGATRVSPVAVAALCFVFACAVEAAQGVGLFKALGLHHAPVAKTIVGATFDPLDIAAYAAGAAFAFLSDIAGARWTARRRSDGK